MLKISVTLLCLVTITSQNVVITVQGRLRGVSKDGYVSYTGIPYGTLNDTGKFKRAGLAPFWLGVREAAQSTCSSASRVEECLRLDVYVPSYGSSSWPVLVWVRGVSGQYNPGKLVQQGIIVVMVYHRIGPQGFVCLNEASIPGNAGVKDVVTALRWVRDNIVAFRGNPAKVVVAGQGFGAAMVEALMLSPTTQGLYHGVILQSGTVLSPLSFNYDAEDRAATLAEMLSDSDDVTSVLNTADIEDIVAKSENLNISYFPFGICVEKEHKKGERLLTETPYDLLQAKKVNSVPMISGYNSDEGYIFAYALKKAKALRRMSRDVAFLLPEELKFVTEREVEAVVEQVKDMYFRNNITMASLLAYHSDAYFISHIHRSIRLHAALSPVYFYQFSHSGAVGVEPEPGVKKTGAAHSDELAYLFPDNGSRVEGDDGAVQKHLLRLWTNFVKYLNPTPSNDQQPRWEPADPLDPRPLTIDSELRMEQLPRSMALHKWHEIYDKYYYGRHSAK